MVRSPTLLLNPYLRRSKSFNTILYADLSILVSKLFVHLSINIILVLLSSHKKVCFGNLSTMSGVKLDTECLRIRCAIFCRRNEYLLHNS